MGIFGVLEPYRAFSLVVYGPLPHGMFQAKPLRQWSLVGLFFLIFNCFGKIRPGTHQTLGLIELKNRPTGRDLSEGIRVMKGHSKTAGTPPVPWPR